MSQAGSQAWAFYRDVAANRILWTIRDDRGFPIPKARDGHRAQPFWSTLSRVKRILADVPAYAGFQPVEMTWDDFLSNWAPRLSRDDIQVGVNWSGKRAVGFDMAPDRVVRSVQALIENPGQKSRH